MRTEAAEIIRELIESVTITTDGGVTAEVEASVLNLIDFATNEKSPREISFRGVFCKRWLRGSDLAAAELRSTFRGDADPRKPLRPLRRQ